MTEREALPTELHTPLTPATTARPPATSPAPWRALRQRLQPRAPDGLSSRLLLLTVAFTLAVAALIIVPSAASFQERWLMDRLQAAELASVGVEALPYSAVEDSTAEQLLSIGGVQSVVIGEQGVRRLLLQAPNLPRAPELIDLRQRNVGARLLDPWKTLFGHPDRSLRVQAAPRYRSGDLVEILAPAQPLKKELEGFLVNSLMMSLLIAAVAGGLLYASLSMLVLQPLRRVTRSIERFAANPESPAETPSDRQDEIGRVERELARMQEEVRQSLRSRARLAALGEAVAKINHDLRNMLTSAQMASERLSTSSDPLVATALPRLERALDRASTLARNVLAYGKTEEPAPQLQKMLLARAVAAAAEDAAGAGWRAAGARPARPLHRQRRPGPASPHPGQSDAQRPPGHRDRAPEQGQERQRRHHRQRRDPRRHGRRHRARRRPRHSAAPGRSPVRALRQRRRGRRHGPGPDHFTRAGGQPRRRPDAAGHRTAGHAFRASVAALGRRTAALRRPGRCFL
ncbi:HAMP domain protein [Brevundimonas diminuta ATCC 11568]|nr:HAMP domain protein [Brevundimonas diminuta ATCC 11568]